jgi:hypothetical protein
VRAAALMCYARCEPSDTWQTSFAPPTLKRSAPRWIPPNQREQTTSALSTSCARGDAAIYILQTASAHEDVQQVGEAGAGCTLAVVVVVLMQDAVFGPTAPGYDVVSTARLNGEDMVMRATRTWLAPPCGRS